MKNCAQIYRMHIRTGGRRQLKGRGGGNLLNMGINLLKAPGQLVTGLFKRDTWKNLFGMGNKGGRYAMPYGGRYGGYSFCNAKFSGYDRKACEALKNPRRFNHQDRDDTMDPGKYPRGGRYGGARCGGARYGGRRGRGLRRKKTRKHIR